MWHWRDCWSKKDSFRLISYFREASHWNFNYSCRRLSHLLCVHHFNMIKRKPVTLLLRWGSGNMVSIQITDVFTFIYCRSRGTLFLSAKCIQYSAQRRRMKYLPTLNGDKTIFKAQQKRKRPAVTWHHYATRPRLLICQSCCWSQRLQGSLWIVLHLLHTRAMATVAMEIQY